MRTDTTKRYRKRYEDIVYRANRIRKRSVYNALRTQKNRFHKLKHMLNSISTNANKEDLRFAWSEL